MIVLRFYPSPRSSVVLDMGRGREKEVIFPTLQRDWVCAVPDCHSPLAVLRDPDGVTRAHCTKDANHPADFVPLAWVEAQEAAQEEAIEGLPEDLRRLVRGEGRKCAPNFSIFSLEKEQL